MFKGLFGGGQPMRLTTDEGESEIVQVTLQGQGGAGGDAERVRRVLPGAIMSDEELRQRLSTKSWLGQVIDGD